MNAAYKHLETRLRIAELTLSQWAAVLGGIALAILWGGFLSPFSKYLTLFTSIYLGGIPTVLALIASQTEFNIFVRLRAMARWRRGADRYEAGAGEAHGYVIVPDPAAARSRVGERVPELDYAALWD